MNYQLILKTAYKLMDIRNILQTDTNSAMQDRPFTVGHITRYL